MNYKLTDPQTELKSAFTLITDPTPAKLLVGAYNDGLLMVVDAALSKTLLTTWSWLVGRDCLPLVTTGFGDVFFWDPTTGVNYLEAQRAHVEFVDAEPKWFVENFLLIPQIVSKVLKKKSFDQLTRLRRPLKYHEVFILEPWQILGGEEKLENYAIGKCDVYLDLVGQFFTQDGAKAGRTHKRRKK
jgi:hypothetical protein